MLKPDQVEKLVAEVKREWNPDKVNELLKHFEPWLIKQGKVLQDMYHIGSNEAMEEIRSTFLRIIMLYDPTHTYKSKGSKKKSKKNFKKIYFVVYCRNKVKMAWVDSEKVTKRRKDERENRKTMTEEKPGLSDFEVKDIIDVNFPGKEKLYKEVFDSILMANWPKALVAEECGISTARVEEIICQLKETFMKYLDPNLE